MIVKRLDIKRHAANIRRSLSVVGSVPDSQNYDPESGIYSPDYTLTHLVLMPDIAASDGTGVTPARNINSELANVKWYVAENGTRTEITDANTAFAITRDGGGAPTGKIIVKRNCNTLGSMTLSFEADYTDTAMGQVHHIRIDRLIRRVAAALVTPELTLDIADQSVYNPIRDVDTVMRPS